MAKTGKFYVHKLSTKSFSFASEHVIIKSYLVVEKLIRNNNCRWSAMLTLESAGGTLELSHLGMTLVKVATLKVFLRQDLTM